MSAQFKHDRTYPRKWYSVTRRGEIHEKTFISESEHRLREPDVRGRKRFENKVTQWCVWHPTLEEAKEHQAGVLNRKLEKAADKRIRDAAPELLEALSDMLEMRELHLADRVHPKGEIQVVEAARSAIAKAKGETA